MVAWILPAHRHQAVVGQADGVSQRPQVLFDETGVEAIVSGGYRCMCSENNLARNPRDGLLETSAFILHAHSNRFQHGKCAVAFV